MNIKTLKEELLKNKKFKREYEKKDLAFEIGEMIIDARIRVGFTQKKLADKVKTKQPSIARLENGNGLPSIGFLEKIARAFGTELIPPKFAFLENNEFASASESAHQTAHDLHPILNYSWSVATPVTQYCAGNDAKSKTEFSKNIEVEGDNNKLLFPVMA